MANEEQTKIIEPDGGATGVFDVLVAAGRDLRFITSEEHRRRILQLPRCARYATQFPSELRARIDVELADYVRHADRFVRDDLESVAWALGKSAEYATSRAGIDNIRTLERFLIEALEAADARLGAAFGAPLPPLCISCGEPATEKAGKGGGTGSDLCARCWRAEFSDPAEGD